MSASSKGALSGLSLGLLRRVASFRNFYRKFVKRPVDILVSATALISCFPVLVVLCAFISLDSPGLPVYKQRRLGKKGILFDIYKLRTMFDGADRHGFKTEPADPRVTRLGNFLREKKLDELPQLWNILRGDMSLIGPRPLSLEESEFVMTELGFSQQHPGFIPTVRPGLTGLEQIYRIHHLVYTERFQWNACYEATLSLLTDLKVLSATVMMCRLVCLATIFGGTLELTFLASMLWH